MNVYTVACYSKCGTYFASYLQSVTVIAGNKEDAIKRTQAWLDKEDRQFLNSDTSKWSVELVCNNTDGGVIDYLEDSDY